MQAPELSLLNLKDIQLPPAIAWWPPAIGWWILAILIPLSIYLSYKLFRYITRKTALKSAKNHLKLLQQNQKLPQQEKLIALSNLMRRIAISLYPRQNVASLTGENWLNFLDKSILNRGFNSDVGYLLTTALYKQNADIQSLAPLINLCETWLNAQKEPKA